MTYRTIICHVIVSRLSGNFSRLSAKVKTTPRAVHASRSRGLFWSLSSRRPMHQIHQSTHYHTLTVLAVASNGTVSSATFDSNRLLKRPAPDDGQQNAGVKWPVGGPRADSRRQSARRSRCHERCLWGGGGGVRPVLGATRCGAGRIRADLGVDRTRKSPVERHCDQSTALEVDSAGAPESSPPPAPPHG